MISILGAYSIWLQLIDSETHLLAHPLTITHPHSHTYSITHSLKKAPILSHSRLMHINTITHTTHRSSHTHVLPHTVHHRLIGVEFYLAQVEIRIRGLAFGEIFANMVPSSSLHYCACCVPRLIFFSCIHAYMFKLHATVLP